MQNVQETDWLTVGARVAVVDGGRTSSVTIHVIERMTATVIILRGSPTKFRRSDLRAMGRRGPWDSTPKIERIDDPYVINIRMHQLVYGVSRRMEPGPDMRRGHSVSMDEMDAELARMHTEMEKVMEQAKRIKEGK